MLSGPATPAGIRSRLLQRRAGGLCGVSLRALPQPHGRGLGRRGEALLGEQMGSDREAAEEEIALLREVDADEEAAMLAP